MATYVADPVEIESIVKPCKGDVDGRGDNDNARAGVSTGEFTIPATDDPASTGMDTAVITMPTITTATTSPGEELKISKNQLKKMEKNKVSPTVHYVTNQSQPTLVKS